jgi:hypothetical protein
MQMEKLMLRKICFIQLSLEEKMLSHTVHGSIILQRLLLPPIELLLFQNNLIRIPLNLCVEAKFIGSLTTPSPL